MSLTALPPIDTLNAESRVTRAFTKPKEVSFGDNTFLSTLKVHFQELCIGKTFETDDKLLDKVIAAEYHRRDNAISITFPATFMDVEMAFKVLYNGVEHAIKLEDKDLTLKGATTTEETDRAGILKVDAGGVMPTMNEIKEMITPIFKEAGCIVEAFGPSNGNYYVQFRDDPEYYANHNAPPALHRLRDITMYDGRLAHYTLCSNFCKNNNYCRTCNKGLDRTAYYQCQGHEMKKPAKRPSPSDLARAAMRKQMRK